MREVDEDDLHLDDVEEHRSRDSRGRVHRCVALLRRAAEAPEDVLPAEAAQQQHRQGEQRERRRDVAEARLEQHRVVQRDVEHARREQQVPHEDLRLGALDHHGRPVAAVVRRGVRLQEGRRQRHSAERHAGKGERAEEERRQIKAVGGQRGPGEHDRDRDLGTRERGTPASKLGSAAECVTQGAQQSGGVADRR